MPCTGTCTGSGCPSYACADKPPAGWQGPFQLFNGPSGQAPSCPTAASNKVLSGVYQGVQAPPAQCSACTVGAPYNFVCFAEVSAFPDAMCSDTDQTSLFFAQDYCSSLGTADYGSGIGVEAPRATYYCDSSPQTPTVPTLSWSTEGLGCAAPSSQAGTCSSNQLCVPTGVAPFDAHQCISKSGDTNCPAQTYTQKSVYYSGTLDKRSCTPCGFTSTAVSCTGTALLYSDTACSDQVGVVTNFSGTCMSLPGTIGSSIMLDASFSGNASCSPTGGQPTGTVTPTGATTVCCTP